MDSLKLIAGIGVFLVALVGGGALFRLAGLSGRIDAVAVVVLAVVVMLAVGLLGTRRRRRLSNPYW